MLACLEIVARRAQLIELRHRDRALGTKALGGDVDSDAHLYMGSGKTRGLLMISPALEEWVAKQLQTETAAAKERRKLREEKAAVPPKAVPKAPKGGGAQQ